jgi:hypothetical protein
VYALARGRFSKNVAVYGTAFGNDSGENWGGMFYEKTFINDLRVASEYGAPGYVATINGKLWVQDIHVNASSKWADYVFGDNYKLMSLEELEAKIKANKHLPGIPSAKEVNENGIMVAEMQTKTMEKVEENTLYILQLNNRIKELEKQNSKITELEKKIEVLMGLLGKK